MTTGKVVPLAGTWIEINVPYLLFNTAVVVPLAGTWIEILNPEVSSSIILSFPLRERGLKLDPEHRERNERCRRSPCGNVD